LPYSSFSRCVMDSAVPSGPSSSSNDSSPYTVA
jgi:hypothetical protein